MDWDGKGGGEEWGDVEGGETIIRIYVIREKNLFSIKGEKEKKYMGECFRQYITRGVKISRIHYQWPPFRIPLTK